MSYTSRSCVIFTMLVALTGCSDYELNPKIDMIPDIHVSPGSIDFGSLHSGFETNISEIIVSNVGTDTLDLNDIYLRSGRSVFTLIPPDESSLEAGEATSIEIAYTPITYSTDTDRIFIESNDPDSPLVVVTLNGAGNAPIIEITPEYYDFGEVDVGCDEKINVNIANVGDADLHVDDVEFFTTLPVDFNFNDNQSIHGSLPWIIPPSSSIDVIIEYIPTDLVDDSSYVEVSSSDPVSPTASADQVALGKYAAIVSESFEQTGESKSDILFVIDNSCSMYRHQTNLANNFSSFINVFATSGVDYQLAFITTDNENFVGGIIDSNHADPIGTVTNIINSIGVSGSGLERGLWESYESTQSGADAGPGSSFLRSDAKLVIIYVSDETDASSRYSTMLPQDYANHLQSLKTSTEQIVAHAVAGDFPSGCNSNGMYAQFGGGYYEVVQALSGTFMSICAVDWGAQMDTLARESMAKSSFQLTDFPIEETIIVTVNGYSSASWSYSITSNSIIFSSPPAMNSTIEVEYAILGNCE